MILKHFLGYLIKKARWGNLLLLGILLLVFNAGIFPAIVGAIEKLSGGIGMLDTRFTYSPEAAYAAISAYGEAGRALYLVSAFTADLIYPLVYGGLLTLLVLWIGRKLPEFRGWRRWAACFPLAGVGLDYCENIAIVSMILNYPGQFFPLARLASVFTTLKWAALSLSLFVVVGFGLAVVYKEIRRGKG